MNGSIRLGIPKGKKLIIVPIINDVEFEPYVIKADAVWIDTE